MEINPIDIFRKWIDEELNLSKVSVPTACCFSTIGIDNYPNARFVSLKEVMEGNFIVTGTLTSRKGIEIRNSSKVAVTFWWTETERQVRIQGNAIMISNELADKYFRSEERRVGKECLALNQGQTLNENTELNEKYKEIEITFANQTLKRPENWGGYAVEPIRIEFLEFKPTRFHHRKLFELISGQWKQTYNPDPKYASC